MRPRGPLLLALALLTACAASEDSANTGVPQDQALTILAASSLSEALSDLAPIFQASHPGIELTLSFAGSQTLATQVRHGIPADLIASADRQHLEALARQGLVEPPRLFAHNELVLALSQPGPGQGARPADLQGLPVVGSLVVGDDPVPLGRYTGELLDAAQLRYGEDWRQAVEARIVSREPNARLVAAKLTMGEADAAIVYATDLATTDHLQAVALPPDLSPDVGYFHARLSAAPQPALAQAWIELVESPEGQATLTARGFQAGAASP